MTMLSTTLVVIVTVSWATVVNGNDVIDRDPLSCPNNCSCRPTLPVTRYITSLTVDCNGYTDVNHRNLSDQLNSLLSSNQTYGRLTSLSIVNSPLTHVPRSVCRLTTLRSLTLNFCRLTELREDCIGNLGELQRLSATNNLITELPDGIFDRMTNLSSLSLTGNRIDRIGLRVFSDISRLKHLRYINLSLNNLTSLEPWPLFLGQVGSQHDEIRVKLSSNKIMTFTNLLGFNSTARHHRHSPVIWLRLDLSRNRIRHVHDILTGWDIRLSDLWSLMHFINGDHALRVELTALSFACDCVDFDVLKLFPAMPNSYKFDHSRCNSTDSVIGTRHVSRVSLDELVCHLAEGCPSGCQCVHRPANGTLHIYCSSRDITVLPFQLPKLPKKWTRYKLDFSSNPLRRLDHRNYFANTSILDVSNCNLDAIDADTWKKLSVIPEVRIDGNRIEDLPSSITSVNLRTSRLHLDGNPWKCSRDASWMSDWLQSINRSLANPNEVTCSSPGRLRGKNILGISKTEFCIDLVRVMGITVSVVAGVLVTLLIVGVVVYRMRVRLFSRLKFHPFDRDECLGEEMGYDVFLSCSSADNLPHGNAIREQLEHSGYRVCYPPRDFLVGEAICDNIYKAVVRSKRTICLLTAHFIDSVYCMQEFDIALHHNIVVKRRKRLIVLMALDSPNDLYANDTPDNMAALRQYLRQYTYIDYAADDWLDKLLYALPIRGMDPFIPDNEDEYDNPVERYNADVGLGLLHPER